jgi:exodeoxyribonuclease VII large subunit
MQIRDNAIQRKIYTVSQLTSDIKALLEESFPFVWIKGEISDFRIPVSGHFYFILKDKKARISAVMFRGQNRKLEFTPEDGMSVTGLGRISLYEPRGTYQILIEYMEPEGVGSLQLAYEQLKARLLAEGLFDKIHKKPIPFLPQKISLITSPSGAVVHDIINVINRRFPNIHIEIIPVKVQGDGADKEIESAIKLLNDRADSDVAILARGGGSLEDLKAFNSENVARAVFDSQIPIISAVGHETDVTIADFVADLRAPTPSAAAELALPEKNELVRRWMEITIRLKSKFYGYIDRQRTALKMIYRRLSDPKKKIQNLILKTDDYTARLIRNFERTIRQKRSLLRELSGRLHALSPAAILDRGYSITRTIPDKVVVRDPKIVDIGQELEIRVAKGFIRCRVGKKSYRKLYNDEEDF